MESQSRYTILGEIASGGTATVYLAEDLKLRRKVALKKLHPHLHTHADVVKRFEKEAVAVASLSHENVVKVYDFGREADQGLYLAMEYVDGATLDSLLTEADGVLPNLAALCLFHQLFEGLAAAHAHGICHRDIKPSNVLVDKKGCVRLADFGIAFLSEETSITKTGSYLGTPGYSAPEQALGKPVTVKTDIFAAGSLMYRSLCGKLPFEGETPHAVLVAIMEKVPRRLNLVNGKVLPELADLVERMLSKTPADRPSAVECSARVAAIAGDLTMSLDSARIRKLREAPAAYAEEDCRELAEHYLERARMAAKQGLTRDAVRSYARAETYAVAGGEIAKEASAFLQRSETALRRRKAALALAGAALMAGSIWMVVRWIREAMPAERHFPETVSAKPPAAGTIEGDAASRPQATGEAHSPVQPAAAARRNQGSAKPKPKTAIKRISHPALPAAAMGFLTIKTNPPFARILVDGKSMGATPLAAPLTLPEGRHVLVLERDGCIPNRSELNIAPAETTSLRFTLNRAEDAP